MIEEGQIQIHTENIFPIIKKAVYSDHEIFLRELVSNGVDAINKRRMASMAGDCEEHDSPQINIKIDRENNTITFSDNGIGMTVDEVKKYINQVAFSSAEEFLEKYKKNDDEIIGHFGLGFYSSFMVAKNVELITKSAIGNADSIKWTCDGSPKFIIEKVDKKNIGTDVILYISEEEKEFIEPSRIRNLIQKYCDFMPVDVMLEGETINKKEPQWRSNPRDLDDNDYIELYKYLYPFQGEPLLWVHLNTDYPYNLQGILYFPKITGRADWENGDIKLYCNQVYVSDSLKEIVPRYLLPLRGVIDSPDIPLNVSRSALQTDRKVRSIGNFISKKVADRLKALKQDDPKFYGEIWDSISPFIKIGAMEDEKFSDQVENLILFATTFQPDGNTKEEDLIITDKNVFTTIQSYTKRLEDNNLDTILYCTDEIAQASALNLWKSQGAEVLKAETVVDTQYIPWLESKNDKIKFKRVDSELDESLKEKNEKITDKEGDTKDEALKKLIEESLNNKNLTIQVQALKGDNSPPAIILLPEQMRRINDMGALMEQKIPGLPDHHVFLVNLNHSLVKSMLKLSEGSLILASGENSSTQKLAEKVAKHIYDLAKLGVGGLEPKEIESFQRQSSELVTELLERGL